MDTCLIWAPKIKYNGRFCLSQQKPINIFFKVNLLNTNNGHFSVFQVTSSHILSTPLYSGYLHTVCFHFKNYVLILTNVPCSNNDRFLWVNMILLLKHSSKNCVSRKCCYNLKNFYGRNSFIDGAKVNCSWWFWS